MSTFLPTKRKMAAIFGPIRARVRFGTLELLGKVDLPEGTEVSVTIQETSSQEDREAFLDAAGKWKGTVDAGTLIRDIYEHRLVSTRAEPQC